MIKVTIYNGIEVEKMIYYGIKITSNTQC